MLFADVISVKEFPRRMFLKVLSVEFHMLCTHLMFNLKSDNDGWGTLPFLRDKVRVSMEGLTAERCKCFLNIFSRLLTYESMYPEDVDL
jgi:arogenate dehydrogenase (NADP+)